MYNKQKYYITVVQSILYLFNTSQLNSIVPSLCT